MLFKWMYYKYKRSTCKRKTCTYKQAVTEIERIYMFCSVCKCLLISECFSHACNSLVYVVHKLKKHALIKQ